MSMRHLIIAVLIILLTVIGNLSIMGGRIETFEEALRRHNIEVSKTGLIAALDNPNAEIVRLAALKLAADNLVDAIPSIIKALEKNPGLQNKLDIGYALAQLGHQKGILALKEICDARNEQNIRLVAARYLLNLGDESCFSAVVDVLERESEIDPRIQALSLLPHFEKALKDNRKRIFDLILQALVNEDSTLRISASSALRALGDCTAIQHLRRAIAREREEAVRLSMQNDLKIMEMKCE